MAELGLRAGHTQAVVLVVLALVGQVLAESADLAGLACALAPKPLSGS